jgi:hypothetical protein
VSVPRWFIDEHLRDLHGATLRVYLALCGQQARVGRKRDFRYTVPEIVEATGLKARAVSMALKDLDKRQLLERHEHLGRVGNRYRVVWGRPAATNGEPTPATTDKPVSGDTAVRQLNPPEPEVVGVVAVKSPLAKRGGPVPLRDFDSSGPPATAPAGEQGDQGAGGREDKEPEAQTAPDNTQLTAREADARPHFLKNRFRHPRNQPRPCSRPLLQRRRTHPNPIPLLPSRHPVPLRWPPKSTHWLAVLLAVPRIQR